VTIAVRIGEFLNRQERTDRWLLEPVRRWNFLPLYRGWFSVLGIRPDGSFVRWDNEDDPDVIKPLIEPYLQRLALCQGAKLYPELRALMPERPPEAITCETCIRWNELPEPPKVICSCGGCGWIIPGEPQGVHPS
jgi:hypothetical protein